MISKPVGLLYGVDDKPGLPTMVLLGIQHIFALSVAFVFPVVVVDAIGGTPEQARVMISVAMIATGIGTILMSLNRGVVGSGFLCPLLNGPAFLSAAILAGKTGGVSLIFGMTAVGGVFEAVFARVVRKMRAVFPPEVTGTIVTMVGIEVIPIAVKRFVGIDRLNNQPDMTCFWVGLATLAAMVCFNVWGKGRLRLFSLLLGLIVGYVLSIFTGLLGAEQLRRIMEAPFLTLPSVGHYGISFDMALLVPFLVATLSSALKAMGDITICQKINDSEWKRPDMKSISRGIMACAVGNIVSGLSGGLGQSVSSSNVGLSIATGATSRIIAIPTGVILILLAFLPKLAMVYVIMPTPVMGASLIFAVSFMILAGIQITMTRMIDSRKTFVIGISIILGLGVDIIPEFWKSIHPWIQPLCSSSLSVATVCAIILNLFFRIGIAKSMNLELVPGPDAQNELFGAMQKHGGLWGARKDIIDRALSALNEFIEAAAVRKLAPDKVDIKVSFDEFNLDADISYQGDLMCFPDTQPSPEELLADETRVAELSAFLIGRYVDSMKSWTRDGKCFIHLHLDH
jgi:NCS2 family nucleobase:cation symporter-2